MIMPTPTTGIHSTLSTAVASIAHTNTGRRPQVSPGARMYKVVAMTLMAVKSEEMPRLMMPR